MQRTRRLLSVSLGIVMLMGLLGGAATLTSALAAPGDGLVANVINPVGSSDKGDGTYTNPNIFADVPDIDICFVDGVYYMTSTTMHMSPGIPVMRSYDLVNWETISYCYLALTDSPANKLSGTNQIYSNGTWASSIDYRDPYFYVSCPSPTGTATYIFRTTDPENVAWTRIATLSRYHDYGLLLDDDGRNWLIGHTSNTQAVNRIELNSTLTATIGSTQNINLASLHAPDPVTGLTPGSSSLNEGVHVEKINGMYYIFAITWPSGRGRSVAVHRSNSLTGPWESKIVAMNGFVANTTTGVLASAGTGDHAPAQGSIIQDAEGNWWGYVFRDSGPVGRCPWLMPITWTDGWPFFGQDALGNGTYTNLPTSGEKPIQGYPLKSVVSSDEFYNNAKKPAYIDSTLPTWVNYAVGEYDYNGSNLIMPWQWNHNPDNRYWSLTERPGWLRLKTMLNSSSTRNILNARNTLTQRTFGPYSAAVTKLDTSHMQNGDEAGLTLFTAKYGFIGVKMESGSKYLVTTLANTWSSGHATDRGQESARISLVGDVVYLKAEANYLVQNNGATNPGDFYYSYDGISWTKLGGTLNMIYGTGNHFMGYRFGLFSFAKTATGGWADFDFFRLYDKLTAATAPTVLGAVMTDATVGNSVTQADITVSLDALPAGNYSQIAASFEIPAGLSVLDVTFSTDVAGSADWEVKGNQLILGVTGAAPDFKPSGGDGLFATISLDATGLDETVVVKPDYIEVRGRGNEYVVFGLTGVESVIDIAPDTFEVTFVVDGVDTVVTVIDGELVEEPDDPVKSGYNFDGWYTDDDALFDFDTPITDDITLTARFTEKVGSEITLSSPDVLMIKKGAYAYVSVFTDANPNQITVSYSPVTFIDVDPVGGQNTVQCITAKKAGTTVLTFGTLAGTASKTIVVIVN